MSKAFNLTAQINLRGPSNLRPVVSSIRKQLSGISVSVDVKLNQSSVKNISATTKKFDTLNNAILKTNASAQSLNSTLSSLSSNLANIQSISVKTSSGISKTSDSVQATTKNIKAASTAIEEFGKQSFLAIKRFAAFSLVTTGVFALINAISGGLKAFVKFDRELIRLQQVTGKGAIALKSLSDEITRLAVSFGVSSESLTNVAVTLAQAGLSAEDTKIALEALAKTELAPSFDNLKDTTEGAIAAIRQFSLETSDLESALGSINAVAAAFAVEASDIIAAIQRTGGVFAAASRGVSEGTEALNEFIAVFTSVRATTRESAETIATGLRTIFTRIQRSRTIDLLKQFGVELQDVEGKFVGPFEAIKRLSEVLNTLDPRDIRFSSIVEELGGFRQIGKVIPLIQQFATAQQALAVAQKGQNSLNEAQAIAQKGLGVQIAKVREQFLALIRDVGKSTAFQGITKLVLGLTSGLISLASAFKPILPLLGLIGAIKGASAIGQFASGFFGGVKQGGGASQVGQNIGSTLSGAKEKEKNETLSKASDVIKENTTAIKALTASLDASLVSLNTNNDLLKTLNQSGGGSSLRGGGRVLGFNKGGVVPGSGRGDKVPALLEPGEVVMNNQAAQKYGRGNLVRMNKFAKGGPVQLSRLEGQSTISNSYDNRIQPNDGVSANLQRKKIEFNKEDTYPVDWKQLAKQIDIEYDQLKSRNTEKKDSSRRYFYAQSLAFEKAIQQTLPKSQLTSSTKGFDYPVDILADNESIASEIKFTKKDVSDNHLLSKLVRHRILSNTLGEYEFTYKQDKDVDIGNLAVYETAPGAKKQFQEWYNTRDYKNASLGGLIQKFAEGSSGGIRVPSGKGRGSKGARGARSKYDFFGIEEYQKWSKPIYDEYYNDPSLTWSSFLGIPMPPEIALYHKMVEDEVFTKGGAGLAVGKKFVRTPSENISDELRPYLEVDPSDPSQLGFYKEVIAKFAKQKAASASQTAKLGKESALTAREDQFAAYTNAENAISEFKKTGMLSLDPGIMGYIKKSINDPDSLPLDSDDIQGIKKKLTKPNLDAFFALTGPESLPVGVQGQRTKLAEVFNSILDTYGSETSDLEIDNIIGGVGSKLMNKSLGGLISNFMAGSVGGVGSSVGKISEDILERIKALGGKGGLVNLAPEAVSNAVRATGVSANQLLKTPVLKAIPDGAKFAPELEKLLEIAEKVQSDKVKQAQKQLEDNMRAASGGAYQFGLVSLYGPNGELGYSDTSDARELLGGDGNTKYLTQIVRKSLPQRYAEALASIQQDIAGLPARGAEAFQYTDIFGSGGPLAFDFDETLVKDADIFAPNGGIDIQGYNDLEKVKKALADSKLTLLGKELAKRLIDYPQLMDNIRVLTARPQSNAPLLASKLASLGLPIPEDKITGVSGGLNKVANLSQLETLIDDNLGNIQSVTAGGKKAYLYREPKGIDPNNQSSQKARASIEGYNLEEIVRNLGVGISADDADPNRPIDYPKGLGAGASIWDIKPTLPTDTKRTNDSSALSRMWAEAQRYVAQNFAFGGKADGPGFEEIRQEIIDKYPQIDWGIRKRKGGFGYNLMGALKSSGGIFGKDSLNFQQPTNLKQLKEFADKLAEKLMSPEELAVGGLAEATGAMSSLMSGLYGNREQQTSKPQKNFGKIALRTGSRIQATYIKEGEAAEARSGQVIADKINSSLYAVQSSSATKGYGPKLYDIVMEAATAQGAMLTSDRRTVSDAAKGVWAYYFNNRSDVNKTPLDPENWVSNSRLLDEKLYGPPETWPSPTDPAWILQTGYSKSASEINNPNLVQKLARGGSSGTVPAMVSNGEAYVPPNIAKKIGYAKLDKMNQADKNGMGKYSSGGSISTFNGPGSGTSDSIGPIGLPEGSYVIREKATKALGLNKGGSVGIRRFKEGGVVGSGGEKGLVLLQKSLVDILRLKQENDPSSKILASGLDRLEDILAASLVEGKLSARSTNEVAKVIRSLIDVGADGNKETVVYLTKVFDRLDAIQKQSGGDALKRPRVERDIAGIKGANVKDLQSILKIFETKQAISPGSPGTEGFGAIQKIINDLENGLISNKEATTQLATAIRVSAISAKKAGNEKEAQSLKKLFDTLDKVQQQKGGTTSLRDITDRRLGIETRRDKSKSLGDLSGLPSAIPQVTEPIEIDLGDIKAQLGPTSERREDLKEAAAMSAFGSGNTTLDVLKSMRDILQEQEATKPSVIEKYKPQFQAATTPEEKKAIIETVKAEKQSSEKQSSEARLIIEDLNALITAEETAIQSAKMRAEAEAYLAEMAKRSGMSLSDFKDKILTEAQSTVEKLQNIQGAKDDLKFAAIGSRQVFKSGTEKDKEATTADLKAKLSAADPTLNMEQLDRAVTQLTEDMKNMTWDEAVAANEALTNAMQRTVTSQEALEQAYLEAVEKYGDAVGSLQDFEAAISQKQKVDAQSKDFGILGKLLPDLTSKFASSKVGGALVKAGRIANDSKGFGDLVGGGLGKVIGKDLGAAVGTKLGGVVSKLGGPIAALGAAASVIGSNLPTLFKSLDQTFGTSLAKSETAAGVAGAISGAGTGAATGATLGSFIPIIGPLIGGIGGAIIGGIQGFFRAQTAKRLENALEALNKSTVDLDKAFKDFDINPTVTGFEKAEKAFGDVTLNAAKLDNIAQANTSYFNPLSYISGPSEEVKQEAIRSRAQASSRAVESAQRLGEERLKSVSTEDIGRQLSAVRAAGTDEGALKSAYAELAKGSVIIEEYQRAQLRANGINIQAGESLDKYTSSQAQRIKTQAAEQAALDAYRSSQQQAGRDVAETEAFIASNRKKAIAEGKKVIGEQTALILKQAELARATKELQLASASLLEVIKRVTAGVDRLSNEQDKYISDLTGFVDGLSGQSKIGPVDRTSEQILANPAAYSVDEIRGAAANLAGITGGTTEASEFANTAVANKIIQDQLPAILAQTEGQNVEEVVDKLKTAIETALPDFDFRGPASSGVNQIFDQITKTLEQNRSSRQGTTFDEIAQSSILETASKTAAEGAKAAASVQKAYNDSLEKSIALQNQAMQKYMEAAEWARKASSIRLNADLELQRALGNNISANQLAAPAEAEIKSLTEGLIQGGSLDPKQISRAIEQQNISNSKLEESINQRQSNFGLLTGGDPQKVKEFGEALEADRAALLKNKQAVNDASSGLKRLAEDGSRAAAALTAIQNAQQAAGAAVNTFKKLLTSSPQEIQQTNKNLEAAIAVQTGTATQAQLQNYEFRQQAFAGADMFGELIPEQGRRAMQADFIEQMLMADPNADMDRVIARYYDPTANEGKGGEVSLTQREALERYRKGPEDSPEVQAYKDAVNVQANAALELGRLANVAAETLVSGSKALFDDLKEKLPGILEKAFADVRGSQAANTTPPTPAGPPIIPPPTGAAGTTLPPDPMGTTPPISAETTRGLAATTVGIGATTAVSGSETGRKLLGSAYGGVRSGTSATVAKGKDLADRAISGARGLLPRSTTPNPFAGMGGAMGSQAAKTAAAKSADDVVKTASKVVGKAAQATAKTTAAVTKTTATFVGGAAKATGKAVPFLAPVIGGVSGYMDDSEEAQKRSGVERTILGALTGDASTGSSFSGMLGLEKGGAADQALGIGGAALTGAATGAAIGSVVPVVGTAVGAAVGAVLGGGAEIYKILTAGDSPLVAWASNLGSSMTEALTSAAGMFLDTTLQLGSLLGTTIYDSISGMWTFLTSSIEGVGQFLYDSAASVGSVIKDFFVGTFGTLGQYIYDAATLPLQIIGSVGEKAYNFIKDYFGGVFSTIADAISSIWNWIKGKRKDAKDASEARKKVEEEKKTAEIKAVEQKQKEEATKKEVATLQQTSPTIQQPMSTTKQPGSINQQQDITRSNIASYTQEPRTISPLNDSGYQLPPQIQARLEEIQSKKEQIQAQQSQLDTPRSLSKEENFRMRQQETGDLGPDIKQSELTREAKLEEIRKNEKRLKYARVAAIGAGTLKTSPNVAKAQEALESSKQDLTAIDQRLASLNQKYISPDQQKQQLAQQQLKELELSEKQLTDPVLNKGLQQIAAMQQSPGSMKYLISPEEQDFMMKTSSGLANAQGFSSSADIENMASQLSSGFANSQYITEAGILMAQSFISQISGGGVQINTGFAEAVRNQESQSTTLPNNISTLTGISLDEDSRQFLSNFNTTINKIGSYIEQLSGINIPDKIELNLNIPGPIEVRVTGAAGFEKLEKSTKDFAETLIVNKLDELRTELNSFSQGAIKGPASRGR